MPAITYQEKSFSAKNEAMIKTANSIIAEYQAAGYSLTLRQLYYQFVARDLIPNTQQDYKRLGKLLSNARNAGRIDWLAIEDRTREVRSNAHWDSGVDILRTCSQQFRYDLWGNQRFRVEVWIEKDALAGVFGPVCSELDVPLFSCRGYTSQSEVWAAGQRLRAHLDCEQHPVILHFGDHDPSGLDMTRDIAERLSLYSESPVEVKRLALNREQVLQYEPPPNPAKVTDSRYAKYVKVHGRKSWELDALEPRVLANLVESEVMFWRDDDAWTEAIARQTDTRERLASLASDWED